MNVLQDTIRIYGYDKMGLKGGSRSMYAAKKNIMRKEFVT